MGRGFRLRTVTPLLWARAITEPSDESRGRRFSSHPLSRKPSPCIGTDASMLIVDIDGRRSIVHREQVPFRVVLVAVGAVVDDISSHPTSQIRDVGHPCSDLGHLSKLVCTVVRDHYRKAASRSCFVCGRSVHVLKSSGSLLRSSKEPCLSPSFKSVKARQKSNSSR
jgi:hypothetical protein